MSRKKSSNSTYTHLFKVCQRPVLAGLCHTFQRVCLWERKRGMDNSRVNITEQLLLTDTGHKTTKCSQIYSKSCRKPSIWGKMVTVATAAHSHTAYYAAHGAKWRSRLCNSTGGMERHASKTHSLICCCANASVQNLQQVFSWGEIKQQHVDATNTRLIYMCLCYNHKHG